MEIIAHIRGTVAEGKHLGRELGFPTANVPIATEGPPDDLADGVYFGQVSIPSLGTYWALVSIGRRPTVERGGTRIAEAYLFGFEGSLYGSEIGIDLLRFLRPEQRFASLDALRAAMEQDRRTALEIIKDSEDPGL